MCELTLNDIDLDANTLNIDKTLFRVSEVYVVKPTTKTGKSGERVIVLDDFTIERKRME
ncbi:hypothetical protein [Cytobacillus solani]|uniref:hypothetical protein n=1 Tax=Cytobacillus solani TaxID=1637975 RepID=UPI003314D5F4